jgi:hypothetical protein
MPGGAAARLYLTEAEIADRVMSGDDRVQRWKGVAAMLERQGLPQKDPVFDNRRYWPAVRDFLDRRAARGATMAVSQPDTEENWHCQPRRRTAGHAHQA